MTQKVLMYTVAIAFAASVIALLWFLLTPDVAWAVLFPYPWMLFVIILGVVGLGMATLGPCNEPQVPEVNGMRPALARRRRGGSRPKSAPEGSPSMIAVEVRVAHIQAP